MTRSEVQIPHRPPLCGVFLFSKIGIHQRLTVGGQPAEEGVTFEDARKELYKLMDDGLIELGNDWRPKLTDKGIETLAGL